MYLQVNAELGHAIPGFCLLHDLLYDKIND
jgi:hypothetical protein